MEISPEDILQSLMNAVGEKGTLIFPVYNFGFTKGIPFDIRNSKSETGILTETARNHKAFVRTGHPMFSLTAAGYYKNELKILITTVLSEKIRLLQYLRNLTVK
ncbi:MAG: AAC(3) family N-acetyltransferase [Ignavibacteria bacterium]